MRHKMKKIDSGMGGGSDENDDKRLQIMSSLSPPQK
jgi:hypothetical protein